MTIARSVPAVFRPAFVMALAAASGAFLLGGEALAVEQWVHKTPGPGPYVRGVRVVPNSPVAGQAVVFASTYTNGVVKIVDNGTTLVTTPMNNGLPVLRVRTVGGPSGDVSNLYVALDGYGVYKTSDGGANWSPANGSGPTALGCMVVRNITVRSLTEVWAVTACRHASGIYRTLDGGGTWSRVGATTIPDDDVGSSLTFSSAVPPVVVYSSLRNGIFRSPDGGTTWAQINTGLPTAGGPNHLSVYNTQFVATSSDMLAYVEGAGVFRSTNSGGSWAASGTGLPSPFYSISGVAKENATSFFIGTDKGPVYHSTDGTNWSAWGNTGTANGTGYTRNVTPDTTAAGRQYLPGIAGLWRTTDNGLTFSQVSFGEGYSSFAALDPDGVTGYLATETLFKIPDVYAWNTSAFVDIGGGLPGTTQGGFVVQDKTQPGTLYASLQYQGLYKTTNGGTNWTKLPMPNVLAGSTLFVEISPSNPQVLYATPGNPFSSATGGGFFQSANGGTSWTESSTGLATPEARDIKSIALSETAPLVIVIATEDGLYRSADGGATWTSVLQLTDPLGGYLPMASVRFDPVNPQVLWAGATHVNPDGTVLATSGVWKSVDGGQNWTQVLSGKRATSVRPENSGRVVVILNRDPSQPAVLATTDGGTTWTPFNVGIVDNDSVSIISAVSELGSRVVIVSMIDGIYVIDKPLVSVQTVGAGQVDSTPAGFTCRGSCSQRYFYNDTVTLVATPDSGSMFAGWSGACTGTGNCTLTIDGAKSVTATFGLPTSIPRLGNISTRMQVLTGNDVLIGGFVIGGSTPKTVVVRARGPSLVPFGITNALANPNLDLYSGSTVIASNNDYGSAANLAALQSSGFAPANAQESAVLATLNPGAYTAIVSGIGSTTGVGIVEVFEVDHPEVPLINISTRGQVLTGNDVMIGGFVIQGDNPQTVVVRARGPSLVPFGITNALANPVLQLYSGSTQIASNDDWQTATNASQVQSSGFAPSNALESAILITLPPGAYTAIVTGAGGGTGVGIVEVFAQ